MFNQILGQWFPGLQQPQPQQTVDGLSHISLEYSEGDLAAATEYFSAARKLGSGTYGAVYRGSLRDGSEVAIKVIEVEENQADGGFADEVRVLSKFRHPNLVTLMGWGRSFGKRFLIYELLAGGDVAHRLAKCKPPNNTKPFTWQERVQVLIDAGTGLSHMHNSKPKAFHRDIKSANVLIDKSGTAKMADFGLSGIAKQKGERHMTCQSISGTPGYACPLYIRTGIVTEKTEVFAFGMLTLEVLMNVQPALMSQSGIVYPIFQTVKPQQAGAHERAMKQLDTGAEWPKALSDALVALALSCVSMEEATRPEFADIVRRLKHLAGGGNPAAAAATATPHVAPTRPQMGGATPPYPHVAPTRPQMGAGVDGTRPQMQAPMQVPSGLADATRPQMGVHSYPGMQAGAAVDGTRPQMQPPMQVPSGHADGTRPQMGVHGYPGKPTGNMTPPMPRPPQQPPVPPPHAQQPPPAAMMATHMWSNPGPPTPYILVCTFARGCEAAALPPATKTINHPGDARVIIGRQHQAGFFEGLLRSEEKFLSFISRSHLEFNPAPGQPQAFDLANLSSNPIMVSQSLTTGKPEKLQKSGRTTVKPPVSIDFIAAVDASSSSPVVFLRLSFEATKEAQRACPPVVPPTAAPAAVLPPSAPCTRRPSAPNLDQSTYDIGRMLPKPSARGGSPSTNERRSSVSASTFSLELSGSVVREDLPPARKIVESMDGSLTIGRRHQQELLAEALRDGVAQFVSRDHFQVKMGASGYTLAALGSNPLWRVRAGDSTQVKSGQPPLQMQPGDKVQLFTGASDGSAEGPGSRGTFFWTLHGPNRGSDDDLLSGDTITVAHTRRAANAVLASRANASDSPGPPQTRHSRDGGVTPTIGSSGRKGGGALQIPVSGVLLENESPSDHTGRMYRSSSGKYNEADDAFSKSGFNYQ